MFGKNPTRKQELGSGETLWVQEIFHTIQGEGPIAGLPATFVRLAGCNLKCHFCDTEFESSKWTPNIGEIIRKIQLITPYGTQWVVLTGGEPLRQNVLPLIEEIKRQCNLKVQIETAGTLWVDGLEKHVEDGSVTIVVSPKTSIVNRNIAIHANAFKYIIKRGEIADDGLPNMSTQALGRADRLFRAPKGKPIFVQACDEQDAVKNQENLEAAAESAMKFGYRLSVQMHKLAKLP